jgi:hypothetical protein
MCILLSAHVFRWPRFATPGVVGEDIERNHAQNVRGCGTYPLWQVENEVTSILTIAAPDKSQLRCAVRRPRPAAGVRSPYRHTCPRACPGNTRWSGNTVEGIVDVEAAQED